MVENWSKMVKNGQKPQKQPKNEVYKSSYVLDSKVRPSKSAVRVPNHPVLRAALLAAPGALSRKNTKSERKNYLQKE